MLDALAVRLRSEAAAAAAKGDEPAAASRVEALRRVATTRAATATNVNPQLALAALAADLETLL